MTLPNVYVIACGGTIAGKAASAEDLTGYQAGCAGIDEVLTSVPSLSQYAHVQGEQFCSIDSSDMTEALWLALSRRVQKLADRDDIDGIVITHGTDTMEETAYFLYLTVQTEKPVVLTGAMRPATALSADGPLNLLEAVQTAADRSAGACGVLLVMNGTICSARFAGKTDTTHVDAFSQYRLGYMGIVQQGRPIFYQVPLRSPEGQRLSCHHVQKLPPVAIVYCYTGMDPAEIAEIGQRVRGIVVAGLGHGRMPAPVWEALQPFMKDGGLVVRSSRAMGGTVTAVPDYDGTIWAGNLTPQKAKILLQLALVQTDDIGNIQELFILG